MGQSFALPLAVTSKYVERFGNQHFRGAAVSMQGWRRDMEDSHVMDCKDAYGLFGVFDGHSGTACSAQCSELLRKRVAESSLPLSDEQLQQMVLEIDAEFLSCDKEEESGSTAVFGLVQPQGAEYCVQVCNVGDSRILVHTGGAMRAMTEDHKPSLAMEEERIQAAGGFVRDNRVNGDLAVSRALGDRPYKVKKVAVPAGAPPKGKKRKQQQASQEDQAQKVVEGASPRELQVIALPEVTRVVLRPGDWLLAACDGIFEPESFSNEEVMRFVADRLAHCQDIGQVLCALCTEALKRGSTDNMTALLVQLADGTSFAQAGELVPGPYDADMGVAKRSYFDFAKNTSQLSVGQTLERRFDLLHRRIEDLRTTPQATAPDFAAMTTAALHQWLTTYGRSECPKKRASLLNVCKAESKQHTFYEENDLDRLQEELEWFKGGPGEGLHGAERTAWFASLVNEGELEGDEAEDEAIALDSLSPEALRQLVEQGFAREMAEEIEEMRAEQGKAKRRPKKKKKKNAASVSEEGLDKATLKKRKKAAAPSGGGAGAETA
eukprot:GGOE01000808.1.p1 GENE.GGOE01000808.1~~GGOE01000808.1.p1  ORF type:complete len:559 (+),score=174.84 GGOE01000808.1:29-1678(+)